MTGPKDAIRGLLGIRSVTERLDRVEDTVRHLALTKDEHQVALDLLTTVEAARIARLEGDLHALREDVVLRRFFAQTTVLDPAAVSVVVLATGDEAALAHSVAAAAELLGADHVPTVVESLDGLTTNIDADRPYVTILRAGDRLALGWLPVAVDQLDRHPEAVGVYGERLDMVAAGTHMVVARFEPSFSTVNLLESACIDLSSVVLRRSALGDASPGTGVLGGWDLVLQLAHQGSLRPVPVTSSVGPMTPASSADEFARFRERWPATTSLDTGRAP